MEQFKKEDVKTAFVEIAKVISVFAIQGTKVVGYIIAALAIFVFLGYLMFNWFFTIITLFAIAAGCTWFYLEMLTAKAIREYEEMVEDFRVEKNKPAHPEYKEQQ